MEYELGTIRIEAEIQEEQDIKIECLSDVATKYSHLEERQKEHLYAIFLSNDNTFLGDKLVSLGSQDCIQFDLKDIARTAVLVKASAVIILHNHPSGNSNPTQQDLEATQEIYNALELLNIELLDHVIISRTNPHSMRQNHDGPF